MQHPLSWDPTHGVQLWCNIAWCAVMVQHVQAQRLLSWDTTQAPHSDTCPHAFGTFQSWLPTTSRGVRVWKRSSAGDSGYTACLHGNAGNMAWSCTAAECLDAHHHSSSAAHVLTATSSIPVGSSSSRISPPGVERDAAAEERVLSNQCCGGGAAVAVRIGKYGVAVTEKRG